MTEIAMLQTENTSWHGGFLKLHRKLNFGEVSNQHALPKVLRFPNFGGGENPALLYKIKIGVGPQLAHERGKRGGARNSASRESHALTLAQVKNLIDASAHAGRIGLALNRMITIHWQAGGVPITGMSKATGRYLDLMTKTLARHGSRTAWIWVHENGDRKGGHCHLLAHVSRDLTGNIVRLQKRWLRSITGRSYKAGVVCSRPIGGYLGLEIGNPTLHAVNLDSVLSYVLKGADNTAAKQKKLTRLEAGGRIIGKRCGVSQNVGPKARKEMQK